MGADGAPIMRQAIGVAVFEGISQYMFDTDVDLIDYAYALTVHKAQGSQFQRVIVPVRRSRILDRTLVYTAVTRAQVQVILIGDGAAIRAAIDQPPKAFSRKVGLGEMLMA
ncbi:RecBCD enzyme subunit RecD [compost metagenome]